MTATELLREARERLVHRRLGKDFFHERDCDTCDFIRAIDTFLSHPEPATSAEEMREACARLLESTINDRQFQNYLTCEEAQLCVDHIRSLDLSRKEKTNAKT